MEKELNAIALHAGATRIEIWTLGARLNAVSWNGHENLVNGSVTLEDALGAKMNHGCVVGPVANRIAGSSFVLNGQTYSFPPNEPDNILCHSGDRSLRDTVWSVASVSDRSAILVAEVADMQDGFPGNRRFEADYRVNENGFDLRLSCETDAPTLVNLALHPYWTLAGKGRAGQTLSIAADTYLPVHPNRIPTGEIAPVEGTIFDLRKAAAPDTRTDHNYCLSPRAADEAAARLLADTGIALEILTDAPGIQVYAGKEIGIAIEPQHWPDAPHHDAFPSIRLDPGKRYEQTTLYRFSKA